jgi:DNA adenine methylase
MPQISTHNPTPLVKWVGGKRQLQTPILGKIVEVFDAQNGTYFEPFFGGGAIYFALQPKKAFASDINAGLVNLYNRVTHDLENVESELVALQASYNDLNADEQQIYYLEKRKIFNEISSDGSFAKRLGATGAALFLFLNKAGFNGMYRENANGEFNIPFGKRSTVNLFEAENLKVASAALRKLDVACQDYSDTVTTAKPGDLVYFDPPYAPLSKTSSFEGYNKSNLGGFDQAALRDLFIELTERGVHCLVSNSSATVIEELYSGFTFSPLTASRAVSASSAGRKSVKEYLIDNFKQVQR